MARKKLDVPDSHTDEIKNIASQYIEEKAIEKDAKKKASSLNKHLKEYLMKSDDNIIKTENGSVKLTWRESDVFDEENLIEHFKRYPDASCIVRTKEYIDYDMLESMLYHEKLPQECVDGIKQYKSVNKTPVLTVGK